LYWVDIAHTHSFCLLLLAFGCILFTRNRMQSNGLFDSFATKIFDLSCSRDFVMLHLYTWKCLSKFHQPNALARVAVSCFVTSSYSASSLRNVEHSTSTKRSQVSLPSQYQDSKFKFTKTPCSLTFSFPPR